jgi:hypothetical protein
VNVDDCNNKLGYIVKISPLNEIITYTTNPKYDLSKDEHRGNENNLKSNDSMIGYFRQITNVNTPGSELCHFILLDSVDFENRDFAYGEDCIFSMNYIQVDIVAIRGQKKDMVTPEEGDYPTLFSNKR